MTRIISSILFLLAMTACTTTNPFLSEWNNPYGIPDYSIIEERHYIPAIEYAINEQNDEINQIISNEEESTFENVIAAYEKSGRLLDKITGVLFNLSETDTNPSLQLIMDDAISMMTEHTTNIFINPDFFAKVDQVYHQKEYLSLTREQEMVLDKIYENFQNNGISLNKADQLRMSEINKTLSKLEQKFGNNLLDQTNAFQLILTNEEIKGLPDFLVRSGANAAKVAGIGEGKYIYTLHSSSYVPFMTYCPNRAMRKKMFLAYSSRGNNDDAQDNKSLVLDIMSLRIEKAKLLGYKTPAEFILSNKMAKSPEVVDEFLSEIFTPALEKAKMEIIDMQVFMDKDIADELIEKGAKIQAWDWAYYAEKVRVEKYALNEEEIKPYFKMENVREGVFKMSKILWGLNFRLLKDAPLYHPEVEIFEVTDSDSSLIGYIATDYFPRSSKRGGAWMNNIRNQEYIDSLNVRPIIVNVGNFSHSVGDMPALLSLDDVETLFHEFGHALHSLLSQCHYKSISGTNVARDFVELPSQICENWAFAPEMLSQYAFHYKTNEVIPNELIEKINNASTFNQGFMTTELVAASILDMEWHNLESLYVSSDSKYASDILSQDDPELRLIDIVKFENEILKKAGLISEIIPRYKTTYFNHIFNSGYNAGYYSYLWAEVLDKDAFEYFTQKGIFNKELATSFRKNILEAGGSEDPMVLYTRFRGAGPDAEALIRARGL